MSLIASSPSRTALAAAALVAASAMPLAAHAQQAARDAETGQLRALTAEEAAALRATAPAGKQITNTLRVAPAEVSLANGGAMLATDESTMMYSVARINAKGQLEQYCVQGKDQVNKVLKARTSSAKPVVGAKHTHEVSYELK